MSDRLSIIIFRSLASALFVAIAAPGCASAPAEPNFKKFTFPKNAFVGDVQRPYVVLGPVRSKVNYQTLDFNREEVDLCKNYFNKAVRDLVKYAKKQGGDAVVDVKSVVFLVDGRTETYATPECSDDGGDGQILAQGVAVKWKGASVESGAWSQPPPRTPAVSAVVAPAAIGPPVVRSKAANPNAPVFPEGGTLVPEQDEVTEAPPAREAPAAQPPSAPSAPVQDSAPVTAKMEPYDPQKDLLSSPTQTVFPPTSTLSFPRQPAAAPAPPAAPAPRYAPGDPRYVPGSIQRVTPP